MSTPFPSTLKRVRTTTATARRVENMQGLISELATRDMLADEIAWFLKFSPSGTRKYVRELRDAGVIEVAHYVEGKENYIGKAVYQLTPDQERIKDFLAAIAEPKLEGKTPPQRLKLREQSLAEAGRHLHIMADDTHYVIRVHRKPAGRDPLVAALFGNVGPSNSGGKP